MSISAVAWCGTMLDALSPTAAGAQPRGGADADAAADRGLVVAGLGEDLLLGGGELDAVVVAGDGDPAVVVLHRGEQAGEAHGGVGDVVAVVTAVQAAPGAVDGEHDVGSAAVAEHQGRPLAGVARAVLDDQGVALEQV